MTSVLLQSEKLSSCSAEARAVVPDALCAWHPLGSSEKRRMPGGATRDADSVGEGLRYQPAGARAPGPEHGLCR